MVDESAIHDLRKEFPNQIIRASAGTGKTFALSNRYLRLLASGAECHTILATTFSRKGAGEILDRIISRLSDAALNDDAAEKLSRELEWKLPRDRAAKLLHQLIANLHRLEVSTLDSYFNRIAKAFSLELGLPPTWDIVDEQQVQRLYNQSIHSVLGSKSVLNLLHMISKGEATRRVASMVRDTVDQLYGIFRESGPAPWDALAMTGKFLSEQELERIIERIQAVELTGKLIPKEWKKIETLALAGDWIGIVSATSFQNVLDGNPKFGRSQLPEAILNVYEDLRSHCVACVEKQLILQNHSTRDLMIAFDDTLEQRKSETGFLRFDDVTLRLERFISSLDVDRFSFRLDNQIQHLLLDEFQDTSLAQWNVIKPFADRVTSNAEDLRSFFCVGDLKQAIFGWRGGIAEIFDLVDQELPNLSESEQLSQSYRSAQPIIDTVNEVFLNLNRYQCNNDVVTKAVHQWSDWFKRHSTARYDLTGYVAIEVAGDSSAQQQSGNQGTPGQTDDVLDQTVNRIRQLVDTIPKWHSIGLIVRSNKEVGEIIFRLQQANIPASEEGGSSLTDSAAVESILSALTLADHPGDSLARFHLSHSPLADELDLEAETDVNQRQNETAAHKSAARLRSRLMNDGYGATIESLARVLIDSCTAREISRLQHLVQVAYDRSAINQPWQLRPSRFVQWIREEVKISSESAAQVRVMTIHKSKGLEFDVVVLPFKTSSRGWTGSPPAVVVGRDAPTQPINVATRHVSQQHQKLLPERFQKLFEDAQKKNAREEMCVLYVALTRAIHATHVILPPNAKPESQSAAGILLATLNAGKKPEEGVIFETGDPHWYESTKQESTQDPFGLGGFYLQPEVTLKPNVLSKQIRSGRGLPITNPSSLKTGKKRVLSDMLKSIVSQRAQTRGTMLHACLELVQWLDEAIPDQSTLQNKLVQTNTTIIDHEQVITDFYKLIKKANVQKLLSRATYQETYLMEFPDPAEIVVEANRLVVLNEYRFAVQLSSEILEGVIDRLILVYQGEQIVAADIIDFKSDRIDGNLLEKIDSYRPQIDAYRHAVSQFANIPIENVVARLVFLNSDQIINLNLMEASTNAAPIKTNSRSTESQSANTPKTSSQQKTLWDD